MLTMPVSVRYIVDDVDAAIPFYTEMLDFKVDMHPGPGFASLSRGDLRLLLNKPGGGGNIAYSYVAKSPPDGHTMLIVPASFTIGPHLSRNPPYHPITEFAPISQVADVPSRLGSGRSGSPPRRGLRRPAPSMHRAAGQGSRPAPAP